MRVSCDTLEKPCGTSRSSRLAYVLSLVAVAVIIIGAFAVFPEDGSAMETVHMTADEPSGAQESTIATRQGQQDETDKIVPEQQIAKDFMQKSAGIASAYMKKIQSVVADDKSVDVGNARNQTNQEDDPQLEQVSEDTKQAALAAYKAVLGSRKQTSTDEAPLVSLLQVDAVIPEDPELLLQKLERQYRDAHKRLDHFSRLNLAAIEEDPVPAAPVAPMVAAPVAAPVVAAPAVAAPAAPAAANPADAAAKASEDAAADKAALAKQQEKKKEKLKKKVAAKLKELKKRKAEEVKKNKERKQKEVVGDISLKRTGMEHLKHVMRRGQSRVQRRFMRAQGKVFKQVTHSIGKMQNSAPGQAALKAAAALRKQNKAASLKYQAWKQSKESYWKDQEEKGKESDIRHTYQESYKAMDTADMYKDAVQRIHDDEAAGGGQKPTNDGVDIKQIDEEAKADADADAGDGDGGAEEDDADAVPAGDGDGSAAVPVPAPASAGDGGGDAPAAPAAPAGHGDGSAAAPATMASQAALQAQFEAMMVTLKTSNTPNDSAVKDAEHTDFIPATNALPSGAGSHTRKQAATVAGKMTPQDAKEPSVEPQRAQEKQAQAKAQEQAKAKLVTEHDDGVKLHVQMNHAQTEENAKSQPNGFNPVAPPVSGQAPEPSPNQMRADWSTPQKAAEKAHIRTESVAHNVQIAPGALIHEINDQDRKETTDAANAEYSAEVKQTKERKAKKQAAKTAKWHQTQRAASKRALPLVEAASKKYAKKHWKQVWGAYQDKEHRPVAREREHLVHPEETRTGDYGAQGVPRSFDEQSSSTLEEVNGDNDKAKDDHVDSGGDAPNVDKKMLGDMQQRADHAEHKAHQNKSTMSQHDVDAAQQTAKAASAAHDAERGAAAVAGLGADQASEGKSQADAVKARMDQQGGSDAPPPKAHFSAGIFATEEMHDHKKKEEDFSKFADMFVEGSSAMPKVETVLKEDLDKEVEKEAAMKEKYEAKLKKLEQQNSDYAEMYHTYKEDATELGKVLKQHHIPFRPELMP